MQIHFDRMMLMVQRAIAAGATVRSLAHVEWDISKDCHNPFMRILTSREDKPWRGKHRPIEVDNTTYYAHHDIDHVYLRFEYEKVVNQFFQLSIWTSCRKCEACLKRRGQLWYRRARTEIRQASRTWFGTLTINPVELFLMENRVRHHFTSRRVSLGEVTPPQYFAQLAREAGREVTLFLKRVRKNSHVKISYLVVVEKHKSGAPHFHILIHEVDQPVRHRVLASAWRAGFSKFNLVDGDKAAGYVSKYLSKSLLARVRASKAYGVERGPTCGVSVNDYNRRMRIETEGNV